MVRLFSGSQSPQAQLFAAARSGNLRKLNALLDSGIAVDIRDRTGRTALFVAAKYGHLTAVQALLARGADVNAADSNQRSVIFSAITSGSPEIITCLIEAGADLEMTDGLGATPAAYARTKLKFQLVQLLLVPSASADESTLLEPSE